MLLMPDGPLVDQLTTVRVVWLHLEATCGHKLKSVIVLQSARSVSWHVSDI